MENNSKNNENRHKVVLEGLFQMLVDTQNIYLKTKNYHWNATGNLFQTYHVMFENQYADLAKDFDLIAQRIRTMGIPAPDSRVQFNHPSATRETQENHKAKDMISDLLDDQEVIIKKALHALSIADEAGDQATKEVISKIINTHEKTAQMFRNLLDNY